MALLLVPKLGPAAAVAIICSTHTVACIWYISFGCLGPLSRRNSFEFVQASLGLGPVSLL